MLYEVITCDVDDGLALLYLIGRKNTDIIGISTTYGNSDIETVYSNTCRVVKELGISIPVIKGAPDKNTLDSPAARFIVESINANKNKISILARITSYNVCYTKLLRGNCPSLILLSAVSG